MVIEKKTDKKTTRKYNYVDDTSASVRGVALLYVCHGHALTGESPKAFS